MNDIPPAAAAQGPVSTAPPQGRPQRPPMQRWPLQVVETSEVTPRMRRAVFSGETLGGFVHRPAQDVVLLLDPPGGGEPLRRHYTVRAFDKDSGRLTIDFVLHGHDSPAESWVKSARPGDRLEIGGPRGRTVLNAEADWHLFTGDETCVPGVLAMLEQLPAGVRAFAFLEVEDEAETQPLDSRGDVTLEWIYRHGPAAPASPALIQRFADFRFPQGRGQAYVIGETSTVRAQRHGLLARGLAKDQILAEGYWRPGRQGGHDHIWDEGEGPAAAPPRPAG